MKSLLYIFILLISSQLNAQFTTASNAIKGKLDNLDTLQSDLIYDKVKFFPNQTEIAIAIIKNNKVSFVGVKRINDSIRTTKNFQKTFEIGSLSKVFTSTLLANYVISNKIDLEDSIQDYLDYNINESITLKNLANHTSGLPRLPSNLNLFTANPKNPYKDYGEKQLKLYLKEQINLKHKPGENFEYSNLGAGLLGYILSKYTNSTYDNLLQNHIFSKFKMTNSTTEISDVEQSLVKGLDQNGRETPNWDFNVLVGAGGIYSSVKDLSMFAKAHFEDKHKALMLTKQPTFTVNENLKIGLGWHILNLKNDKKLIWHNGATGGYSSSMALDTNSKNGVIILSNVSAYHPKMQNIDQLCFDLMSTF